MREIKFRAWDKQERVMYENAQGAYDFTDMFTSGDAIPATCFQEILDKPDRWDIMQYTGLKDKNGVEIFEGDVCIVAGIGNCEVIFEYTSWLFENDQHSQEFSGCEDLRTAEVIGNIHQNPELFEVVK